MAKTKKLSGTDASYKEFLENLDLYAVGLENLSSRLDRATYSKVASDSAADLIYEIKNRFELSEFEDDHFDVSATFILEAKVKDQDPHLSVEATFSAHIHPKKGGVLGEEFAKKFAGAEARLVLWPYFRQTVADLTSRMHIHPITIPLTFRP